MVKSSCNFIFYAHFFDRRFILFGLEDFLACGSKIQIALIHIEGEYYFFYNKCSSIHNLYLHVIIQT